MYRIAFLLALFAAVTDAAQEATVATGSDTRPETNEPRADAEVEEDAPDTFDPTEEVSEDYSIEFPVDI